MTQDKLSPKYSGRFKLSRNWLKGQLGDAVHAILCGVGHNIRLLLRHLRYFFGLDLGIGFVLWGQQKSWIHQYASQPSRLK